MLTCVHGRACPFPANFVVKYMQDQALKDSVYQFHKASRRLAMPPLADFVGWRRTRRQARAASSSATASTAVRTDSSAGTMGAGLWWCLALTSAAAAWLTLAAAACGALAVLRPSEFRRLLARWHRPAALRRLERALARAAAERRQRPPRVPTGGLHGAMPRSCSLSQLAESRGFEARTDASALLGATPEAPRPLSGKRRSLSASDLADMIRLA